MTDGSKRPGSAGSSKWLSPGGSRSTAPRTVVFQRHEMPECQKHEIARFSSGRWRPTRREFSGYLQGGPRCDREWRSWLAHGASLAHVQARKFAPMVFVSADIGGHSEHFDVRCAGSRDGR